MRDLPKFRGSCLGGLAIRLLFIPQQLSLGRLLPKYSEQEWVLVLSGIPAKDTVPLKQIE